MQKIPINFTQHLQQTLGSENVLTDPAECWAYGYDNSRRQGFPGAVVFAYTTEQIQQLVKLCNEHKIALTVRGRGTGTPGGAVPLNNSVVLSCERMNKIIKVDPDNRALVTQPGAINQAIQQAAEDVGFFWPPDPGSAAYCTIGGNLAYNSAGPRAVKYGTPRDNILALTAVTGAGDIIRTGTYTTKGVVGYDLTRLLIGSEGTLAIITEATLKLTPLPETQQTLRAIYSDLNAATEAVAHIMAQPITPCALEFLDSKAIQLIRQQSVSLPEKAHALLLIDIDGLKDAMPAAIERVKQAATNAGLLEISVAANATEAKQLWSARKALSPALRTIAPGKINEDVVVPVTHISALINGLEKLSQHYQMTIVNFGHAGNGNIHVNLLFDPAIEQQQKNAQACLNEVFDLVLKLHGTLSGEHGVGLEKRDFIDRELDKYSLQLMRQIKSVFDPNNILNPDKMLPCYEDK